MKSSFQLLLALVYAFIASCADISSNKYYNMLLSEEPMTEEHFCAMLNLSKDCLADSLFAAVHSSIMDILVIDRGMKRANLILNTLSLLKTDNGISEIGMAVQACKANLERLLGKQSLTDPLDQDLFEPAEGIDMEDLKNRWRAYLHRLADYQMKAAVDAMRAERPKLAILHQKAAIDIILAIKNISE